MHDIFDFIKNGAKKRAWSIFIFVLVYKLYLHNLSFFKLTGFDNYINLALFLSFISIFSDFLYWLAKEYKLIADYTRLSYSYSILKKSIKNIEECTMLKNVNKFDTFLDSRKQREIVKLRNYAAQTNSYYLKSIFSDEKVTKDLITLDRLPISINERLSPSKGAKLINQSNNKENRRLEELQKIKRSFNTLKELHNCIKMEKEDIRAKSILIHNFFECSYLIFLPLITLVNFLIRKTTPELKDTK